MSKLIEGKVVHFNNALKVGQVEGPDGVLYQADAEVIAASGVGQLVEGSKVFFIPAPQKKKKQPRISKLFDEAGAAEYLQAHPEVMVQFEEVTLPGPPDYRKGAEKFNNPFNFVRPVKPLAEQETEFKKPFVPHDLYQGLSGIIVCRLKTLTPFFTPDARTITEESKGTSKGHKRMDYFSLDPLSAQPRLPAIPAATVRGVIRSVCEAVTNSTFSAISADHLDRRCMPGESLKLSVGRVVSLPTESEPGKIQELKAAKLPFDLVDLIPDWAEDGGEAWVTLEKRGQTSAVVTEVFREKPEDSTVYHGYFKLTGRNVLRDEKGDNPKKNERFFYEEEGLGEVIFDVQEKENYDTLIKEQRERAEKQVKNSENAEVAQAILDRNNYPLQIGHLVYFSKQGKQAINLGYVSIPRWRYRRAIIDALDPFFHPSSNAEKLCPASRLFGFVFDRGIYKGTRPKRSAYGGRVFFSDAMFIGEKVRYANYTTLEILSSPKPTTCEFYLRNPDNPTDVWVDKEGKNPHHKIYDNEDMQLRGRKFYPHQPDRGQYQWQDKEKMQKENSQNSTVRLLAEGNEFEFTVRFENLDDYELGMLLWSLALENGMAHKMGLGKPLGLGSVKIEVKELRTTCRRTRYQNLFKKDENKFEEGLSDPVTNWQQEYVKLFENWMSGRFGTEFGKLLNICDLRAILRYPADTTTPIHYPLLPGENSKSYEWFMKNRNPDLIREDKAQVLPFPVVTNGVPGHLNRKITITKKKKKKS